VEEEGEGPLRKGGRGRCKDILTTSIQKKRGSAGGGGENGRSRKEYIAEKWEGIFSHGGKGRSIEGGRGKRGKTRVVGEGKEKDLM